MKAKQVKLAQGLKGETSVFMEDTKYDMVFKGSMLHIRNKVNSKGMKFTVFPANIAYIISEDNDETIWFNEPSCVPPVGASINHGQAAAAHGATFGPPITKTKAKK